MGVRVCVSTVGDVHQGMEQKMRSKEEAKLYSSSACFFFHQCIAESEKSTNRILQK